MEKYIVEILSSHRREVLIVLLFVIVVIWLISRLTNKEDKWVSKEKFQQRKGKNASTFFGGGISQVLCFSKILSRRICKKKIRENSLSGLFE